MQLALLVAALDELVEGDVRPLAPGVLGRGERHVPGEEDRGVEEHELRNELRRPRRELEREPSTERVADQDRLARSDALDDRLEMRADVPRRLPRRVAVAEEVGGDDVVARESRRERREVSAVIAHAVEADDAWCSGLAPLVERERHSVASASSESGTISVPPLVAFLHERPDHRSAPVDQEGAAVGRAVRLVEDAVGLRRGAVRPEVRGERVLGAELLLPGLPCRRTGRRRRRRSPSPRRGTTAGSPGGRAPRPRRRA